MKNSRNIKYNRLKSFLRGNKDINYQKLIEDINANEEWQEIIKSIIEIEDIDFEQKIIWNNIKAEIYEDSKIKGRKRIINNLSRYAAIIFIFFIILFLYTDLYKPHKINNNLSHTNNKKVFIELYNGEKIELANTKNNTALDIKNIHIRIDSSHSKSYTSNGTKSGLCRYNKIVIPRGLQNKIILEDGSTVWLNSDSELKYPIYFSKKERIVYLKGEGYFEVSKDTKRPFHVIIDKININVLGTSFNVNAYRDLGSITTTLMSGRIKITDGKDIINIYPNQQVKYTNNGFKIKQVNAKDYSMWTEGIFRFNNMHLYLIMNQIEKWYDVNVHFEDINIRNHQFSGSINKKYTLIEILNIIEKSTKVKFEIKDQDIFVKYKQ